MTSHILTRVGGSYRERATWARRRWIDRSRRGEFRDVVLPLDWETAGYNRIAVLNKIAGITGARSYLEIGCQSDASFLAVACDHKVGVDSESGGTHRMTSDAFFDINLEQFDLVFLDGLHEYSQALRDVNNSVGVLNKGGVIVMHDCLPTDYSEQAMPRQQGLWTGDVWKAVMEVKGRVDVDVRVVGVDHGCGIVLPRPRTDAPSLPSGTIRDMSYGVLDEYWREFGVIDYSEIREWIDGYLMDIRSANS